MNKRAQAMQIAKRMFRLPDSALVDIDIVNGLTNAGYCLSAKALRKANYESMYDSYYANLWIEEAVSLIYQREVKLTGWEILWTNYQIFVGSGWSEMRTRLVSQAQELWRKVFNSRTAK